MNSHPVKLAISFFFHTPSIKKKILPFIKDSFKKYTILAPIHIIGKFLYILMNRALDIVDEVSFEKKFNVETSFVVYQKGLNFTDSEAQRNAARYRPVSPSRVTRAVKYLKKHHLTNKAEPITFIDYGCGAGRAMILAADLGFDTVIGLDLSPELIKTCSLNAERFKKLQKSSEVSPKFEVLLEDATTYSPPAGTKVYFFFDPFSHDIYDSVIEKIKAAAAQDSDDAYIIDVRSTYDYEEKGFTLLKDMYETRVLHYSC